jgi:hypothetical protein
MKELFQKLIELGEIIDTDVTSTKIGDVVKPGTDTDTLEMIRNEYMCFIEWLYEWCGDKEELMK